MRINGSRQFKGNDGKSYLVQDAHKADRHKGKYVLTVKVNGVYKLCYDALFDLLVKRHFKWCNDCAVAAN